MSITDAAIAAISTTNPAARIAAIDAVSEEITVQRECGTHLVDYRDGCDEAHDAERAAEILEAADRLYVSSVFEALGL